MDNLTMFTAIIGFVSPLFISLITQPKWSTNARVLTTIGFCIVAGFVNSYLSGNLNGSDIVTSILVIMFAAITFYEGIFKPTGIAKTVEEATSPTGEPTTRKPLGKHSKIG